jgi:site-specific DNA-methyltransferase (adenine-specific)
MMRSGDRPYWQHERATLYGGDALAVLASLPDASVDAVITDPPYSSGGKFRGDRVSDAHGKYIRGASASGQELPTFTGDSRDQRGYAYWCALWLAECLRVTRASGACVLFTDWRQLPVTTDALQAGGWMWRGIVPWVKPLGSVRPIPGRFQAQCEYAIWATAGSLIIDRSGSCLPGFLHGAAPRVDDRDHITQKPMSVMRELVKIAPKGGTILDPFMGSGTTGVAAVHEGRSFTGAELAPHYQRIARERIEASIVGYRDDGRQMALA